MPLPGNAIAMPYKVPPRINVAYQGHTDNSKQIEHAAQAVKWPMVPRGSAKGRPLAIVGGGAPLFLDELRAWKGDIWAVNDVFNHLRDQGIASTFFACDSCIELADKVEHVERAVIASICHPEMFKRLTASGARINIFHPDNTVKNAPFEAWGHATALSRAHQVGVYMGYGSQTYFGASGSYASMTATQSHVYHKPANELAVDSIIVRANRQYFRSNLVLSGQSEFMRQLIAANPKYFREQSGGMLRAFLADPDWEIVKYSDDILAQFKPMPQEALQSVETRSRFLQAAAYSVPQSAGA